MNDLEVQAKSLVERARAGDQNAMGLLTMIARAAKKGNPKAKRSAVAILAYAKKNPPTKFGAEKMIPVGLIHALHTEQGQRLINAVKRAVQYTGGAEAAAIILANRVPLTQTRISYLASDFGSEDEAQIFTFGIMQPSAKASGPLKQKLAPMGNVCLEAGRCFGYARAIQLVRLPQTRVSRFNSMVGWELGE